MRSTKKGSPQCPERVRLGMGNKNCRLPTVHPSNPSTLRRRQRARPSVRPAILTKPSVCAASSVVNSNPDFLQQDE